MQTLKKGNPNLTIEAKKLKKEKDFQESMEHINQIDKRLSESFYAIEADSFASHQIWKQWFYDVPKEKREYEFIQDHSGKAIEIGRLDKRPVVLDFSWFIINGHRVLFYYCSSQVCDWEMIDKWIQKYMPHLKYKSDAQNAHNVIHYCKKEEKIIPKKEIKCYTCMDSKQVEERRIGYDSIMGKCPNCR